jgi:ubiquinone/menaquinone biosynthesis C-methylase UbiE
MRAIYDDIAPRYDAAMKPLERWFLSRWRAEALAYLPTRSRILEVGAGTGLNFRHYPQGSSGVASELSREMLRLANLKNKPEGLRLVQNDAESMPFADSSFDAAVATLVFCSIPAPAQALAELRRVIAPGGRIVFLEHVRPAGLMGPIFDALNFVTVRLCGDHCNRRTAESVRAAGMKIERLEQRFLGVFNLIVCRV